jgi:hypothetical protein
MEGYMQHRDLEQVRALLGHTPIETTRLRLVEIHGLFQLRWPDRTCRIQVRNFIAR